jgi:transposase
LKGYVTNLEAPRPEFVLGAYHQLRQIEKSFRMSKSDLRARPIYHHKPDSIEAHLSIVFAALAISQLIERSTGWSIARLVKSCAAATQSRSKPAIKPSPPLTRYPRTCSKR